jgi:hypothetical protein
MSTDVKGMDTDEDCSPREAFLNPCHPVVIRVITFKPCGIAALRDD